MEDEVGQGSVGAGEEIHRCVVAGPGWAPEQSRLRKGELVGARGNACAEAGRAPRAALPPPLARPKPAQPLAPARTALRGLSRAAGVSSRSLPRGSTGRL